MSFSNNKPPARSRSCRLPPPFTSLCAGGACLIYLSLRDTNIVCCDRARPSHFNWVKLFISCEKYDHSHSMFYLQQGEHVYSYVLLPHSLIPVCGLLIGALTAASREAFELAQHRFQLDLVLTSLLLHIVRPSVICMVDI